MATAGRTGHLHERHLELSRHHGQRRLRGVCDMNGDGLDDIATLDSSRDLVVHYQNADGTYSQVDYGAVAGPANGA